MAIIKQDAIVPLGRMLFIPKDGNLKKEDLIIEASGQYKFAEKPDCYVIKNDDCCRSITVTVKTKEE